ncbi:MAG TPA: hypothetical protein P5056_01950 [Candidatus Paceibacterota bacterium]|nr:hypothetical protein [Candidatus Paceibacterota bacterium]
MRFLAWALILFSCALSAGAIWFLALIWIQTTPFFIGLFATPIHEMCHLDAIGAVEWYTGKNAIILKVSLFNADFNSLTDFLRSIMEMDESARYMGYVKWFDEDEFSWEERFFVSLMGGVGSTIFILCLWFASWKCFMRGVGTNIFDYTIIFVFCHAPFILATMESLDYAFLEASRMGAPIIFL